MNRTSILTARNDQPGFIGLQRQMHHALLAQHPEWIESNGQSPTCDSYESRLLELLSHSLTFEPRTSGWKDGQRFGQPASVSF